MDKKDVLIEKMKNTQTKNIIGDIIIILVCTVFFAIVICFSYKCGYEAAKIDERTKVPVVIETISEPQKDTLVTFFGDGQKDTSYIYTFYNIVVE